MDRSPGGSYRLAPSIEASTHRKRTSWNRSSLSESLPSFRLHEESLSASSEAQRRYSVSPDPDPLSLRGIVWALVLFGWFAFAIISINTATPASTKYLTGKIERTFTSDKFWAPLVPNGFERRSDDGTTLTLTKIVREPSSSHEATFIYLTGLGEDATANGLPDIFANRTGVRWVTLTPPKRFVRAAHDLFGQDLLYAWFNMQRWPYDYLDDRDEQSMIAAARAMDAVVQSETSLLLDARARQNESRADASKRIVIGGFSQGAVMALLSGLTARDRVGGVIALSAYLPFRKSMPMIVQTSQRANLPIFMGHGALDLVVTMQGAKDSVQFLKEQLHMDDVTFKQYDDIGHAKCPQEAIDIDEWLTERRLLE